MGLESNISTTTTSVKPTKLSVESDRVQKEHVIQMQDMKLKHGWLGLLFGSNENVPSYIIGIVTILLILTASIYTFIPNDKMPPKELWAIVAPIVTSILGYIFGVKSKGKKSEEE